MHVVYDFIISTKLICAIYHFEQHYIGTYTYRMFFLDSINRVEHFLFAIASDIDNS